MFSREKFEKVFKRQSNGLTQSNINNYFKVIMNNQIQSINILNRHLNANDEQNLRHKGKHNDGSVTDEIEDVEILRDDRDLSEDDNNRILAKSVVLRKSKTPVESLMLQNMNFSFIKPNKNYVVEKSNEIAKEGIVKNSVDDTFHNAARPIFFLGQCFAVMPVMGILSSDPKRLKFSYKSIQVIGTLFFMCSSAVLTLTMLKFLIKSGINAKNFVGLVFFGCVQFACTLFASLAQRWPKIMRYWSRVETIFTQPPYEMLKSGLMSRVRIAAYCIIFCSAVEHGLYLASAILTYKRRIELCTHVHNNTEEVSFEDYVRRNYNYVFEILPYNLFVGVFILIINGSCTFIWNYMDLFIMMVSKGIAYRFEQITKRINKLADKEIPETVFIEIREHYVKLCELLEFIDENLSGIILLSCINNLYFVCYQLLNIFNKLRWPINYIYFWYSLLYLIGRTAFVFLAAASINDESKGGLPVLRKVSSRTWCVEVERLIFEMTTQTVALSGKKFYFLTRRLLFGMAGTIVTYELVLLQFDEPNRSKGLPDLCA